MQASRRQLALVLALGTGCVGVVGESEVGDDESISPVTDRGSTRDSGARTLEEPGSHDDDGRSEVPLDEPSGDDQLGGSVCPKSLEPPLASGLRIREVALYQTVQVPLYRDGAWLTRRSLPIVQGKAALVRVFVDALADYEPHRVRGVLTLRTGQREVELTNERLITSDSLDAQLASTFTFEVPAEQLAPTTELSVALQELDCLAETGDAEYARVPAQGTQTLSPTSIRTLRVVLVPVRIDGRVPDTSQAELDKMEAALLAYYPVPAVELSVHEPLVWQGPIAPTDTATWSDVLDEVMALRKAEAPDDDVYYFGLLQPAATFRSYCGPEGCVLGLAPQTSRVQPSAQIAVGASFADAQTYETMVHELGHAHGRGHSPCVRGGDITGVDVDYPQEDGATGSWGWDARAKELMPPSHRDIMGYCSPNWISAYTYQALADRSLAVNTKARLYGGLAVASWRPIILYESGAARWGSTAESTLPGGDLELADVLDATGTVLRQIEVVRVALSHAPNGALLYLPDPQSSWAALRLRDRTLNLENVLAPR